MSSKKLFKKKKSIKKPKWFLSFLCILTVCGIFGYIIWDATAYPLVDMFFSQGEYDYPSGYIDEITLMSADGLTEEDYEVISDFSFKQTAMNTPMIIRLDNREVCNSAFAIAVLVYNPNSTTSSTKFLIHWNPQTDPNAQKLYDYQCRSGLFLTYCFDVKDFYIDYESRTLYLGKVEVIRRFSLPTILSINPATSTLSGTIWPSITGVVEALDLTPSDRSLLEGLTHIESQSSITRGEANGIRVNLFSLTGTAYDGEKYETIDEFKIGKENHRLHVDSNSSFRRNYRTNLVKDYGCFIAVIVLIAALIINTIYYLRKKSVYDIFEYRKKTTNAMAHDLKTPLAIASLSVANLKENLNKNSERVEYHANEIEESIQHMNQLICNILSFSNSEDITRKFAKNDVDVKQEIESYKKRIENTLSNRKMTLEIIGEAKRITDKSIWNQAIFNLIDNAVKYGIECSTISVMLSDKEIVIKNSVDKDVLQTDTLKEPFVKGDNSRGENSGSGLGLAIADNNLTALGYKLKVSCDNKVFKAVIL